MILFSNFIEKVTQYSWRSVFEGTRRLKGLLSRVPLILTGHLSVEVGLAMVLFIKQIQHLRKKSGLLYTALYLKQCSVALQRAYAGNPIDSSASVSVSLTRSGYPRIIPVRHRHIISCHSDRSDYLVRLYLSWFGLSRIIVIGKPVTKSLFESITEPIKDLDSVREVLDLMKSHFKSIHRKSLPWISTIPLNKGMVWQPTWKTVPNDDRIFFGRGLELPKGWHRPVPQIFTSLKYEIAAFAKNIEFLHSRQDGFFSPGILFAPRILYALDNKYTTESVNLDLEYYESRLALGFHSVTQAYSDLFPGRLASVIEGGGKRRIFAIGNYIKQRLLFPVHQWCMNVLKHLPSDGTFNQLGPIERLSHLRPLKVYSYDLKSATDRWPLSVIYTLFGLLFGPSFSSAVVNSCLAMNTFWLSKPLTKRPYLVSFVAGQPLGYYSSWALFSLSHHYVVWLAAELCGHQGCFRSYAVLGDDVVIAHPEVAVQYRELLSKLGVSISVDKSLISETGCLEFAKKYWVKSVQTDLSPLSMRALLTIRSTLGIVQLAQLYNIRNPNVLFRLAGAGFRVRARLYSSKRNKRWERLWVVSTKPLHGSKLPLEWWIGRGKPINPYLKGLIVYWLRNELKPKEIRLIPEELLFDGEREILERTVIHNWIKMWLKWLSWYNSINLMPDPPLSSFFEAPICSTSWRKSLEDLDFFKYGLLWKCYDKGAGKWSEGFCPPVLAADTVILFPGWIYGGTKGDQFMMAPVVDQTTDGKR